MPSAANITIFGAGSIVFSLALVKDVCLTKSLSGSAITFMDINQERLDMIHSLATRYAEDLGADLRFTKTTDRQAALRGADFVVSAATVNDEYYNRKSREMTDKYGYFYGRTGMHRYWNPVLMLDVARDMERLCPNAWLIQAGNPVFDGTTYVTRESGIKMVGLCHGHYGYRGVASTIGLDPAKVTFQAPGVNHNIWMTDFYYEGKDAYPLLDEWIATQAEAFWAEKQKTGDGIPMQMSPAAIHQYKMYGLMPIGDTVRRGGWWYHDGMPARLRWYGGPFGAKDSPEGRNRVIAGKERKYAEMTKAAFDPKVRPIDLFGSERTREQHVPIIDALVNDHEGQFQVNVPNKGALAGVADDVAVEVPAVVNIKGIQPLRVNPLPRKVLLEQILPEVLRMEVELEALKTGDRSMVLWSILNSHETRSYDQAVEVLDALLAMEHTDSTPAMKLMTPMCEFYRFPKAL